MNVHYVLASGASCCEQSCVLTEETKSITDCACSILLASFWVSRMNLNLQSLGPAKLHRSRLIAGWIALLPNVENMLNMISSFLPATKERPIRHCRHRSWPSCGDPQCLSTKMIQNEPRDLPEVVFISCRRAFLNKVLGIDGMNRHRLQTPDSWCLYASSLKMTIFILPVCR